jgi:transposase InsO family protein
MNSIFEQIYFDPQHPAAFGGAYKLYQYAKLQDDRITLENVKNWLSTRDEYTLYKPTKQNFKRNKIYVSYINEQWEIDLLDYSSFSKSNFGYKYLITIIDVFSKYLYVIPIKTKSMQEVTSKLTLLFDKVRPTKIRSDRGKEFDNSGFRALCQKYNINHFVTENQTKKCAVVERVNKTLRIKIERFMNYNNTRRYIHMVKHLVKAYNSSIHRSTGMAPEDIDEEDEEIVFKNLYGADNMIELLKKEGKIKFEIGDKVLRKNDPKPLEKGYRKQWDPQVYKLRKVYNRLNKPVYSLELRDHKLRRRFYPEELQKVNHE